MDYQGHKRSSVDANKYNIKALYDIIIANMAKNEKKTIMIKGNELLIYRQ